MEIHQVWKRETHDVDADWTNGVPSMQYLTNVLQTAVNNMVYNFLRPFIENVTVILVWNGTNWVSG